MRLILPTISIALFLCACTTGVKMRSVNYGALFHDGNSKVWMLNKVKVGGKDYSPKEKRDKDILIFYENGKCCFQPLKTLGDLPGKKGVYSVFSSEKTITLYFKNEKWDFKMIDIGENKVILKPTRNSDLKYTVEIIPLPEL